MLKLKIELIRKGFPTKETFLRQKLIKLMFETVRSEQDEAHADEATGVY